MKVIKNKKLIEDITGVDLSNSDAELIVAEDEDEVAQALNEAYQLSKESIEDYVASVASGGKKIKPMYYNVLFLGAAGVGKTARVNAWAGKMAEQKLPVRVVTYDVSQMDAVDLGGIPIKMDKDVNGKMVPTIQKVASDELKGNFLNTTDEVVVFFDEVNAGRPDVIGALFKFVDEHIVNAPGYRQGEDYGDIIVPHDNQIFLPNYIFTVAACNPDDGTGRTYDLPKPFLDRMSYIITIKSSKAFTRSVFAKKYGQSKRPADAGRLGIAMKLLAPDSEFQFSDAYDDFDIANLGAFEKSCSPRTLEQALGKSFGKKEKFIEIAQKEWASWPEIVRAVEDSLEDYEDIDDKSNQGLKMAQAKYEKKTDTVGNIFDDLGLDDL